MKVRAQPGEVIGNRYRVGKLIGRGSMADVFEAQDTQTSANVALKILRGTLIKNSEAVERLNREAEAQGRIDHRNVAKVLGSGITQHKEPFLVVELLRGISLRTVVKKGPIDIGHAASYAWQALQGLHAAHLQQIHHRDLKPANIMLEPSPGPVERVVLIDFGFADLRGKARLTIQGQVVGSLAYLAPERLTGERGTPQADIYGIAVILYELICGQRPFVADNEFALMRMHLQGEVVPPSHHAPQIPPLLNQVIVRALAKDPSERPAHALAMAEDIAAAMANYQAPS